MRMWKINPKYLCNKHLLGEHVEMHMFAGTLLKNKSITGYIEKDLIEPQNIQSRHDELASEMIKRGMKHKSPLSFFFTNYTHTIPIKESVSELIRRCPECRTRFYNAEDGQT